MNRHEQFIHTDMNWNDEQAPVAADQRKSHSEAVAHQVASLLRDPSKGVHAQAVETLCGWGVEVVHNSMTCGEAAFKRYAVAAGCSWHRNSISRERGIRALISSGWTKLAAKYVAENCLDGKQHVIQDPRWTGVTG